MAGQQMHEEQTCSFPQGVLTLYNLGITLLSAYMLAEVSVRKNSYVGHSRNFMVSINTDLKYLKKLFSA